MPAETRMKRAVPENSMPTMNLSPFRAQARTLPVHTGEAEVGFLGVEILPEKLESRILDLAIGSAGG